jgi:transcriptional regulator with XRE-family HTH domain
MSTIEIDRQWFLDRLAGRQLSQRQLAKQLGLDPAAITLILQNRRKITNEEAQQIASLLGVAVTEVLRRAGIDVRDDVRRVPIAGIVAGEGKVTFLPDSTHDHVTCPADIPASGFAVQVRFASNYKDGWLYFVSGEKLEPNDLIDKFLIAVTEDGQARLCVLRRGYKAGTFNLMLICSSTVMENQKLAWVSPVVWIRPL